ncbi:MAG: hypothetical protein ACRBBN_08385 [Methyloligellaceae bacterium]
MNFSIMDEFKKHGTLLGMVGAVGGFISDVLQPLAPLSYYVFIVSAVASIILILTFAVLKSRRQKLFHAFLLTSAFAVFSGIFVGLGSEQTQAKGVLASKIPAIEQLQSQLGLLQRDIAEIKKETKKTNVIVSKIEKSSKETAQATKQIAKSLEAIQQGFSKLSSSGGVIPSPTQPEEFYHNARIHEQGGDYLKARKSYNRLFSFKLKYLDPHLRYQTFLKVQEGRAGAREIYSALYERDKQPVVEFARILLFDAPQRTVMLQAFIKANEEFAPAYYELSKEYSAARKGVQTLNDKREELKALETFTKLHEKGKFIKYFIDKELAAKWISDTKTRLKALEVLKRTASAPPVKLSLNRHNAGWNATLLMQEDAKEIFYRVGNEGDFKSTGLTEVISQKTGFPVPKIYFPLAANTKPGVIQVKYTDAGGESRGPFNLEFNPNAALFKSQKDILGQTRTSWVSYRDFDGKLLVYFTHMISYRCALKEVRYSIDNSDLDKVFPVPECDPKNPYSVPTDSKIYMEAPKDTKFFTVQVTYHDGTKSEPNRFDR